VIEERTGLKIACLEEIAFRNNWIGKNELDTIIQNYRGNSYGKYLEKMLDIQ
jgi:glucose-1-phosphate thymidylyltransferase